MYIKININSVPCSTIIICIMYVFVSEDPDRTVHIDIFTSTSNKRDNFLDNIYIDIMFKYSCGPDIQT